MTRNQVKFRLGSPAPVDTYRPERWHYAYFLKTGAEQEIERRNMTLLFTDDLLPEIEGTLNPNPG